MNQGQSNGSESQGHSGSGSSGGSTFVSDSIREVVKKIPADHCEDPKAIVDTILLLLDCVDIDLTSELTDQFCDWKELVGLEWCKQTGSHYWVHDHCGFWGHQFCSYCGTAKYPEIPGRCSECSDLAKITEDQYKNR